MRAARRARRFMVYQIAGLPVKPGPAKSSSVVFLFVAQAVFTSNLCLFSFLHAILPGDDNSAGTEPANREQNP